jgi:hypothetical protein
MKHVFTSAGLLALGAVALHGYDPEMTRQVGGRPWTVAATVRGFYDDNVNTSPKRFEQDSFGLEVSPSVHVNLPFEQTFVSLGYIYSLKWYQDRDPNDIDQSHEFNARLRHQFSPRHDLGVTESFILTSEPTVADRGNFISAPMRTRTRSDILHNRAAIEDNIGLNQQIALGFGYVNNWYDYEQENTFFEPFGSRSALLDRIEHLFRADFRYQFTPTLVGLLGYQFGINDYTGDDVIAFHPVTGRPIMSDIRDSYSHYLYAGAEYDITAKLRASVRGGGQYTDYHESGETAANPYADASLAYVYLPGSSVDIGVRHSRNATDIAAPDGKGRPTLDAESTVVYAQVIHRITSQLTGSLLGQYQTSTFNDGANDDRSEDLYLVGVNFSYRFNRHFTADAGYNYDMLSSDISGRNYDRNRYYVGVRATY